jgi:hypothetical protein
VNMVQCNRAYVAAGGVLSVRRTAALCNAPPPHLMDMSQLGVLHNPLSHKPVLYTLAPHHHPTPHHDALKVFCCHLSLIPFPNTHTPTQQKRKHKNTETRTHSRQWRGGDVIDGLLPGVLCQQTCHMEGNQAGTTGGQGDRTD